ncbi:Polyadenylate-binding protein [Actinidia chinensis var. chinensis]|uniref:Polyadenylate-binding protein n=1 Tax=Actinidia chinensis var. chinensis TaxID=1590841 RepID=A0A2R6PS76_ACTCC|nr:Polyadenylate-binding protein [Actinidia chinensis var. chinensis]
MGCRNRNLHGEESVAPNSLSDALLFTTMCIIGLPVDVHVKDGSIYTGIFHAARVENDYGIMLKKARMTKKGKCDSNVANWDLIETLVVQSNDLVQVIAKGISLPADGVISNVAGDDARDIASAILSLECAAGGVKIKKSNKINRDKMQPSQTRQVGDDRSQVKQFDYKGSADFQMEGTTHEVQSSGSSLDTCYTQSKAVKEMHQDRSSKMLPNGALSGPPASSVVKPNDKCQDSPHPNDASLRAPISGTSIVEGSEKACVNSSSTRTEIVPPRSSSSTSKLNPGAKVFCPSFANHRSVTPPAVPTAANVAYVPDFPVVPIVSAQQEAEISQFVPRSSLPVKLVPYGNLIAGNGIIDSQYSQSIIGHVGSRAQSHRYAGQHHSIQAGPNYMHPSSQNAMVGRRGQLVYIHPVSHDMNQGVAVLSQVSTRPLMTPHQGHLPKHQGNAATQALQLCVTPPFISGGQQPYVVQSHVPFPQSAFPVIRPFPVPGSNGSFGPKFP